jgi:hypothetical protein
VCHAILGGPQQPRGRETVVHAQPLKGVANMVGDGVVRKAEATADFLAAEVLVHQPKDFTLALGQPPELVVPIVVIPVHVNNPALSQSGAQVHRGFAARPQNPWLQA